MTYEHLPLAIEQAFSDLRVPVSIVESSLAPQVIRYRLQPGWFPYARASTPKRRITVREVSSKMDDISIAIKINGLNLVMSEGLWLEVPRKTREFVYSIPVSGGVLSCGLGISVANKPIVIDFDSSATPHLLIAGSTGGGKSTLLKYIIADMVARYDKSKLALALIDPKGTEFKNFGHLKHLRFPIAKDAESTIELLRSSADIMDERNALMDTSGIESFSELNTQHLVVVIDEYADIYYRDKRVQGYIMRIAQMGRSAGVHIVLATQRPDAKMLDGMIRANFPARVAFAVPDRSSSGVIIDSAGAENLLSFGDALFLSVNGLVRIQCPMMHKRTLEQIVKANSVSRMRNTMRACEPTTLEIITKYIRDIKAVLKS